MQTYCLQVETTIHLDFRFSLLTFHFRKKHYVAIVPADLRSAGSEYKDLFNPLKIKTHYIW